MRLATTLSILLFIVGSARAQGKPSPDEQATILAGIRGYAGNYTRNLPNFTATQTIQSVTQSVGGGSSAKPDPPVVIEEQLSIVDHRETHKVIKLDGKMVSDKDKPSLPQFSRGEFGNLLAAIFSPDAKTSFEWTRTDTLNGRAVQIFSFKVPAAAGYELQERTRTSRVPYEGQVWADAQTSAIMRVKFTCVEIPAASNYKALDLSVEYKEVAVAGKSYILPAQNHLSIRTKMEQIETNGAYKEYERLASDGTPGQNQSGAKEGRN